MKHSLTKMASPSTPTGTEPMGTGYLSNAFSLNMLALDGLDDARSVTVHVTPLTLEQAQRLARTLPSFIGHEDTARLFAKLLGRDVDCNRATLRLASGEFLLVGQYSGPRLPEGTVELPPGSTIRWLRVDFGGPSP